jgi:hypothetical protein
MVRFEVIKLKEVDKFNVKEILEEKYQRDDNPIWINFLFANDVIAAIKNGMSILQQEDVSIERYGGIYYKGVELRW